MAHMAHDDMRNIVKDLLIEKSPSLRLDSAVVRSKPSYLIHPVNGRSTAFAMLYVDVDRLECSGGKIIF